MTIIILVSVCFAEWASAPLWSQHLPPFVLQLRPSPEKQKTSSSRRKSSTLPGSIRHGDEARPWSYHSIINSCLNGRFTRLDVCRDGNWWYFVVHNLSIIGLKMDFNGNSRTSSFRDLYGLCDLRCPEEILGHKSESNVMTFSLSLCLPVDASESADETLHFASIFEALISIIIVRLMAQSRRRASADLR